MPTNAGVPMPMLAGGTLNPWDWIEQGNPANFHQSAIMRGTPGFASPYQRRQIAEPALIKQGVPVYVHSRPYSRGAPAFAPKSGMLAINPIGAGVVGSYKLPVVAGPAGRYEWGGIWFDVQTIPTSLRINPTVPIETVNALLQTSYVGGMIATTG